MKAKTASEFVREQPITLPVKDVVALARRSGYPTCSHQLVYTVRSKMKSLDASRERAAAHFAKYEKKSREPRYTESEREFMRLAMELGLAQSAQLVSGVRERIKAAL